MQNIKALCVFEREMLPASCKMRVLQISSCGVCLCCGRIMRELRDEIQQLRKAGAVKVYGLTFANVEEK